MRNKTVNTSCLLYTLCWEWFCVTVWKKDNQKNVWISTWTFGLALAAHFQPPGEMKRSFTHMSLMALSKRSRDVMLGFYLALPSLWLTGFQWCWDQGSSQPSPWCCSSSSWASHHLLSGVSRAASWRNLVVQSLSIQGESFFSRTFM